MGVQTSFCHLTNLAPAFYYYLWDIASKLPVYPQCHHDSVNTKTRKVGRESSEREEGREGTPHNDVTVRDFVASAGIRKRQREQPTLDCAHFHLVGWDLKDVCKIIGFFYLPFVTVNKRGASLGLRRYIGN